MQRHLRGRKSITQQRNQDFKRPSKTDNLPINAMKIVDGKDDETDMSSDDKELDDVAKNVLSAIEKHKRNGVNG